LLSINGLLDDMCLQKRVTSYLVLYTMHCLQCYIKRIEILNVFSYKYQNY